MWPGDCSKELLPDANWAEALATPGYADAVFVDSVQQHAQYLIDFDTQARTCCGIMPCCTYCSMRRRDAQTFVWIWSVVAWMFWNSLLLEHC